MPEEISTVQALEAEAADAPSQVFVVLYGPAGPEVADLPDGQTLTVGRSRRAALRVDHPQVSRQHARIRRRGQDITVEDLRSTNGTWVSGTRIRGTRRIEPGDEVRVGPARIVLGVAARAGATTAPSVVMDPALERVYRIARRVAATPTTVLILGETGAGKERLAEEIHRQSPRAGGPFLRLNCAALPEGLLESELFGHERGAFTGAERRKEGFFEAAGGGTLLLDEIGELSPALQAKLLRVLEDRMVTHLGGTQAIPVDVRILCATNRDIEERVRGGNFRQDLFFRVSAFSLTVPPLRERPGAVALLARYFCAECAQAAGKPVPTLDDETLARLEAYRWPGNVRELRNAIEHAVVMASAGRVAVEHLPERIVVGPPPAVERGMRGRLDAAERREIVEALSACGGNQTHAAKRLGLSRRAFIYKMRKHRI
jgi:two-component system, NtrC family, response regulator AtoC